MNKFKSLFVGKLTAGLVMAMAISAIIPSTVAFAEDPVILVVSRAQIFRTSLAGQDMATKVKDIQAKIAEDQKKEMEGLTADVEKLRQDQATYTADQLKQKQFELAQRQEFIQYKYQQENQVVQETAQNKVLSALYPILRTIMEEKSGTILLDQSGLLMASADYNITAEAIKRLDESKPTVEVERILYADMVKAAQERQEKAKAEAEAATAAE
jgi:Skp family chaperone for outer membrane proteins